MLNIQVMGDQSSGKSSLVNYLFGNISVRETGSQAIDTQFTIIETVSEHTFKKLVGKAEYNKLLIKHKDQTIDWLTEPLQPENDSRRDIVWRELRVNSSMIIVDIH
jgi:GTPase SAR1 family protein